jgi:hypothetical protein
MPTSRPKRSRLASLRLTPGELTVLRRKAHAAGLALSAYLRQAGLQKMIRARRGQAERDAIYQLSKIGNNLNQLARAANTAGQVVALEMLEAAIERLRDVLDELMG